MVCVCVCAAGSVQLHRGQVHWWECQTDQRNVQLCKGPPAMHYLHGRDRRHRWVTLSICQTEAGIQAFIVKQIELPVSWAKICTRVLLIWWNLNSSTARHMYHTTYGHWGRAEFVFYKHVKDKAEHKDKSKSSLTFELATYSSLCAVTCFAVAVKLCTGFWASHIYGTTMTIMAPISRHQTWRDLSKFMSIECIVNELWLISCQAPPLCKAAMFLDQYCWFLEQFCVSGCIDRWCWWWWSITSTLTWTQVQVGCHVCVVGGRRFSEGTSADREIQRTLMEVTHTATHHKLLLL